jgi:crotonobetainyl-CoA:carnitine CoA-transferase CaiB-like acyl-CoA transferase
MNKVRLNPEQQLYVIECSDGYTCFGFANARNHANQIAQKLRRPDLVSTDEDYATLAGHEKYRAAVLAWSQTP